MNNLKTQFLGFMNTPYLFKELDGLSQIKLDINEIKEFDFTELNITSKLTLGSRIERFFEFYIKQSKNYELIKKNIQIINNKQTLGEIDFLLYDKKAEEYLHVEHVYKFYLYDDSIENELDRYIGPNRNDTFVKKLEKLKIKQLPLLYKNETQEYLEGIDVNSFKQKICLKGNIYVPMHFLGKDIPILNNSCVRGFYIKREEFIKQKHFREYKYHLPPRNDWVCDCNTNEIWISFDGVIDTIDILLNQQKSPLLWLKNKKNISQSFFVTWW